MEASIRILVDNTVYQRNLLAEHGFSACIVLENRIILFDTGQTGILISNATALGINLMQVDSIVLSHGHYDHTGGLRTVLDQNTNAVVYAHPAVFRQRFGRSKNGKIESIGTNGDFIVNRENRKLVLSSEPFELSKGVWMTGEIPRKNELEIVGNNFLVPGERGKFTKDSINDDQALVFKTPGGTGILLGCAHAGVINTLTRAREITGQDGIAFIIGGMHLVDASDERLDFTVEKLRESGVRKLMPCHCTGQKAIRRLIYEFPEFCIPCFTGFVFNLTS